MNLRKVLLNVKQKRLHEEKRQSMLDTIKKVDRYCSEKRFLALN